MIAVSLALLGFATADLVRWSPDPASRERTTVAAIVAITATGAVAALSGFGPLGVVGTILATAIVVTVWLGLDRPTLPPGFALAWIAASLLVALAISGAPDEVGGGIADWLSGLPFDAGSDADQFLVGVSGGLFLLATANRVIRLVLTAAGTPLALGESRLRGGRLLGPMERLVAMAFLLAGSPAAVAVVVAAKSLLRLPEIRRSDGASPPQQDEVTEYFLIGTFGSLLLAGAVALLVLAQG